MSARQGVPSVAADAFHLLQLCAARVMCDIGENSEESDFFFLPAPVALDLKYALFLNT